VGTGWEVKHRHHPPGIFKKEIYRTLISKIENSYILNSLEAFSKIIGLL
jgi:hypothetical protein